MISQHLEEFDSNLTNSGDRKGETAKDLCHHIPHWLFVATKNKIKSTPTVGCSIKEVWNHFKDVQQMINKNKEDTQVEIKGTILDALQRPLELIAASSSTTQDFLCKLTQIQSWLQVV